ncbi:MAG: type I 3-dehydroquinate dehydratase [Bacteroidetes bacterium]|nr:type I 3-dehydroquinate dehydratase [Bacteroidota bacterium]
MLVLSCSPKNFSEYFNAVKTARKYSAYLLEVRIENIKLKVFYDILQDKSTKKIITFRKENISKTTFSRIKELYHTACQCNVKFIDIDFNWGKKNINELILQSQKSKIILSYHDFFRTTGFAELKRILERMIKVKADVNKISVYANSIEENEKIFRLLEYAQKNKIKLAAHCMGELGKVSRILGKKFGSHLTYSSVTENSETAAGQLPIEKLVKIFNHEQINRNTKIFGIIGKPLEQSKSWLFHNYGYSIRNINAAYVNFLTENVQRFVKTFQNYIGGLSVTIPHKEKIIFLPKEVPSIVKHIGSANTVLFKGGKIHLSNTDYLGMKNLIKKNLMLQNRNVLIIGAGGTARAMIYALREFRNKIFITNRTMQRAKLLAEEFKIILLDNIGKKDLYFDVIINATPGENKYLLSTTRRVLEKGSVKLIMDVALNSFESKFISLAKKHNCKVINGFDFFLEQAHIQFELFTKSNLPRNKMRKYLLKNFNKSF